jgi:hypothetical protein
MLNRQETIALIRDQVRSTVDPMFLKIRAELFGSTFGKTIKDSLISSTVIASAVEEGVEQAAGSGYAVSYTAGSGGIQEGKVVYFDGSVVHHADSTTIGHAGKVVGVSTSAAGPGDPVYVQMYGALDLPSSLSLTPASPLLLGLNGAPVSSLPGSAVFAQYVGIALSTTKMFVYVTPEVYIL